ncbi:hypothetical protein D7V97_00590 [Corallococcus sp. CA053C]|uniref:hypothetical protein n=1 Tax=Corallococcus sp. CA053C TaxID=2316732 RepID=UPI000EA29F34|nr:hypothetical protein [Corallococcus sp. CA053C]RKH15335.1 hypothetical protein D7V97_00590 [Corallococcus sp. CA053C]
MKLPLASSLMVLCSVFSLACGTDVAEPTLAAQEQSLLSIGKSCSSDSQCSSGLCWNTADSYPTYNPSWESGNACTVECTSGTAGDTYCKQLAAQYGAPYPSSARCLHARGVYDNGDDSIVYICDLVRAGLGSYWSE